MQASEKKNYFLASFLVAEQLVPLSASGAHEKHCIQSKKAAALKKNASCLKPALFRKKGQLKVSAWLCVFL